MTPFNPLPYEAEINSIRGDYDALRQRLPGPITESEEAEWAIDYADQEIAQAKVHPDQANKSHLDEVVTNASRAVRRLQEFIEAAGDM